MANYSLILDTKFKPFSYAEMLAPVQAATEAHQELEARYGDLALKANEWGRKANEQTDPYAYKMYKTYSEDLERMAEQLARRGLNPASRRNMLDMRSRYASEILPIETAYKRREELAGEQRKALASNPTMLYQRMASHISLDDFIANPSLDYGQQYSGALITQQVANAASNIAKEARDSVEGRRKLRRILPFQYEIVQQSGFSRDAVMKAILNSPDADKILTGLVDSAIQTSGVGRLDSNGNMSGEGWGDLVTRKRAYDYAKQGLYNAIGQTQYQVVTDQFGMQNTLDAIKAARDRAANNNIDAGHARLNPKALRSKNEMDEIEANFNKFKKYFYTDSNGQIKMNYAGWKEYNKRIEGDVTPITRDWKNKKPQSVPSEFRRFMDDLGAAEVSKNGYQPGNMGLIWRDKVLKKRDSSSYDTYHTTEYDRQLDSGYGKEYFTQMKANSNDKLYEVEFDGKNGFKKLNDKPLSPEDLEGYTVSSVRYTRKYGDTAILTADGKRTIRVQVPKGMHLSNENNVRTALSFADQYGEILDKGLKPKVTSRGMIQTDRNGNVLFTNTPLDEDDIAFFSMSRSNALDDMSMYGSQYVVPSKTKDEEYAVIPNL